MSDVSSIVRDTRRPTCAVALIALCFFTFAACEDGDKGTSSPGEGVGVADGEGGMGPEDCYSPSQPGSAYEVGAVGCGCSEYADRDICVGGAALICQDGKWISAEDGPCLPRSDECSGTTNSWQDCLLQFETCIETEDGSFCGLSSHGGLEQERPTCPTNFDWSEVCADYFDGLGSQVIEGCGYTWIRAHHADSTRNTIVDSAGVVVFQQWDDPLSTLNPLGCRGGAIPQCPDLPDDVYDEWSDVDIVQRGDQCLSGLGGSGPE